MASAAGGTGPGKGREELQEQNSSLDWMLDSSHVNVGLWNHFDGHRFVTEEQGVHDREELPQQSSSLDRSLPPSHVNVDLLRRLDPRAFRAEETWGVADREEGLRGRLDTKCVDPSDIALDFSPTLNNAHYHNTSARFIQDNPPSWTSGSTVGFIKSSHEQHTGFSRSIFDESDYNHVGRPALRDNYGRYLHDFEMGYGYPYLFDRTSQTRPLVDGPSGYGTVTTDFKDWYNPDTAPDKLQNAFAKHGEKPHADVLPSPMDGSHQLQESVRNQSVKTYDQIIPEDHWASPSILASDGTFNCQRCNYPRRFRREADFRRHVAALHPTRKVWITVDISPDKKFLAHCEACRTGKKYERYSNAAAHLRETHSFPPKGLPSLKTIRGGGVYLPSTIKVLNEWLKEVDEVTDRDPQVTHSAAPELPVFEDGRSVDKNSKSMHKKQRTYWEYGGPQTDNPYQLSFATTDQSLARFPKYPIRVEDASMTSNGSANSIQSIDSGYISDLTRLDCNQMTERDRDTWSKVVDDGDLFVKDDPTHRDPEMEVCPPKAESGNRHRIEVKRESFKALDEMSNIRDWRESSNKGERFSNKTDPGIDGYKDGDLASPKPHLNQYQQPSEQRNMKRKWDSYLASAAPITSAGDESETPTDLFPWQSSRVTRHRRMHTGKRPYKCSVGQCDKSFCRKTTLIKHTQRAHRMSTDNQHSKEESSGSESEESPVTETRSMPQSHWPHPDQSNSPVKGLAENSIDGSQSTMNFKTEPMTPFTYQESHSGTRHPRMADHFGFTSNSVMHGTNTGLFPSAAVKTSHINDEEGPARLKVNKKYHLKDSACTVKAEPDSVDAPSVTTVPVITFNMKPGHPKHRNTVPLPFGHPKSRQWAEMLPSIKACTREIMGKGNRGALELFLVNEEPTICITCWDPLKLNLALVRSCMEPLGLRINITQGKIAKSASNEHEGSSGAAVSDQGQYMFSSSVHGHYTQRPTCGASLGTADGPLKSGKVSLGGYLKIKHLYQSHWSYYAMTVHHILVSDDQKDDSLSVTGNDEDEEMAEPGYDYSPGICNGVYELGDGPAVRVTLSCPAVPDVKSLVARLEGRRIKRCANENYAAIDNLDNLDDLLNRVCTREGTNFGNAAWSSGLCLDQDVEMDWLLIGDLPVGRIGCNNPGDVAAYMEGSQRAPIFNGCWTPSVHVDESAFSTLMNFSAQEWGKPGSEGGYLSRVFGRGSETGLADGFLSPHPSIFYDETYGPYDAWAFAPRRPYGLGDSGDSGTWIFTSEGKLLGQIISYNRARHITYFTPVCKIFNHIKRITGATDVELLRPGDVTENPRVMSRSAGGLPSPEEEPVGPNNSRTSMVTEMGPRVDSSAGRKRFFTPPRTPASPSQPLSLPFNHNTCSTARLSTPSFTQASDSSD